MTVDRSTPVLVINGTIGSGKTTVLGEISDLLNEANVPHAAVDFDALTQVFPRDYSDAFGWRIGARNLEAIWDNAQRAGAERLVLASVIENRDELDLIRGAVPNARLFVCRLDAPTETLVRRVRRREVGSGRARHLDRAVELAAKLQAGEVDDLVIDTMGRPVRAIAAEILEACGWPHLHH